MSVAENKNTGKIFYGAGAFAKKHVNRLISMGFVPTCFADSDISKHYKVIETHHGKFEILPLREAILRYPNSEIFVTVSRLSFAKVCGELIADGIYPNRIKPAPLCDDLQPAVSLMQNIIQNGNVEKIEILANRTEFTVRILNDKFIKLNGNNSTYAILGSDNYEQDELGAVFRILSRLPEKACIFDVGANVGYYSICCKTWFPEMTVHAFEPSQATYNALVENIALNKLENIITNNFGLYSEEQVMELFAPEEISGHASLRKILGVREYEKEICKFTTLDSYVEKSNIQQVDFIKCDVEGAELFVYKGGRKTLEKYKPVVLSEILYSEAFGYPHDEIISFFADLGYTCFRIIKGDFEPVTEIRKEYGKNYIFMHGSNDYGSCCPSDLKTV